MIGESAVYSFSLCLDVLSLFFGWIQVCKKFLETLINEWHEIKNEIDTKQLQTEFAEVIQKIQEQAKEDEHRTDLANITLAKDELNKADGPAMLKYLKKIGNFGKDIIVEIGAEALKKIILGQ